MNYLYIILVIFLTFLIANWVIPRLGMSHGEYSRKLLHIASGIGFFFLPYFLTKEEIIFTCAVFFCALAITRYTNLMPSIHRVSRNTHGELYFHIGTALLAYFFLPLEQSYFQFGILVLGLSDGAAEVVGRKWGQKKLPVVDSKSWVGSFAFFITTLVIFLGLIYPAGDHSLFDGVIIALALTIVEAIFVIGLDNLFLPLIAALILRLLN